MATHFAGTCAGATPDNPPNRSMPAKQLRDQSNHNHDRSPSHLLGAHSGRHEWSTPLPGHVWLLFSSVRVVILPVISTTQCRVYGHMEFPVLSPAQPQAPQAKFSSFFKRHCILVHSSGLPLPDRIDRTPQP